MSETLDLNATLQEAFISVLLGRTDVQLTTVHTDPNDGSTFESFGTFRLESALESRIRSMAQSGTFDGLISDTLNAIKPAELANHLQEKLVVAIVQGVLDRRANNYGRDRSFFESEGRKIAVEAMTAAAQADEELMDTLRSKIGMQVDRNRVQIAVNLSDPEATI